MNLEKVKYFLSISDKINDEVFMVVFSVFSSKKKRVLLEFSPFERSLSFEGLLSSLERCLFLARLLFSAFHHFEG